MSKNRHERKLRSLLLLLARSRRGFEANGHRDTGIHIANLRNGGDLSLLVSRKHVEMVTYNGREAHRITDEGMKVLEETS
jgi:hypothetical protein